jgi:hypothetical protein
MEAEGEGGEKVAGAGEAGVGLAVAADGGDKVGPEDVGGGGEERVLGAGDVGKEITRAAGGAKRAGQGESAVRRWYLEPELGWNPEIHLAELPAVGGERRN